MNDWKLHIRDENNRIEVYQCGLIAGQKVRLKKRLDITCEGKPTGKYHGVGAVWTVLAGVTSDPVLWFRNDKGERCTWDDDKDSIAEWFEKIGE